MLKIRNLGLLLALSSVAALPACSMFGGGNDNSQTSSAAAPSAPPAQPNYSTQQQVAAQQPLTPDTIRQVQQTLQQQGLYHARVDGVWGPGTEAAVRSYQQKNNLSTSGQLDQQTLASLNLGTDQNSQNYSNNGQQPNNQQPNNQTQPMNQAPRQQNAQSNQTNPTTRTP